MSEVRGEFACVAEAFGQPTLSLLNQKQAPVIVAILNSCFTREMRLVPTARLHVQVESMLAEMATSGATDDLRAGTGREVCQRWTKARWLIRRTDMVSM